MEFKKEGVPHRRVSKGSHRVTTVPQIQITTGPVRASRQSLWRGAGAGGRGGEGGLPAKPEPNNCMILLRTWKIMPTGTL